MILYFIVLVLASLLTMVQSDCSEFDHQWKTCPSDMLPSSVMNNAYCISKSNTSAKVIIVDSGKKTAMISCHNDIFPDNTFQCLPFGHTKLLILNDCPFPQSSFDKFFSSSSSLNELTIRNSDSHILQTSLHLRNLPQLEFLSIKNVHSFSYFDLVLNSVPLMKSIKISNSTFTSLPKRPFEELSRLKGLALTNGIIEELPDDFLLGISLQVLDLSMNKLKNFQPSLLKDMQGLKRLNLSHNLLEEIDEVLFSDTVRLEVLLLQHNRIRSLPADLFKTSINIKNLDISYNKLTKIPDNIFQELKEMKILELSHNNLKVLPPNAFNSGENKLEKIDLSNNKISRFSSLAPFGNSRRLQKVNISKNNFDEFVNLDWNLYNIKELDMSGNLIRELTLPTPANPEVLILLRNNNIRGVTVTKNLTVDYMYALSGNPFNCNCNLSGFISYLTAVVDADKLICQEPWYRTNKSLISFQNKTELCEINNTCPLECKCHLLPDNQVEVYCNNTRIESAAILLPFQTTILHLENNLISSLSDIDDRMWENITHLYLSNNSLTSLQNWSIPLGLKLLAVDGNNLINLPSSVMEKITETDDFSVYLKGNSWPCDCQIIPLKLWMMKNIAKVKDSHITYCRPYYDNKFDCPIVKIPLDKLHCLEAQHSTQLSNSCVKSEIHIIASVIFLILLCFANKIL